MSREPLVGRHHRPPTTLAIPSKTDFFNTIRRFSLERFGGPKKYAEAVNTCLTKVGQLLHEPDQLRRLLLWESA